ncbi:hypothetical protein BBF96_10520 [Anoxybacter fermentans]|uniref:Spore coat protein n=1 Tax=Anoxybacter fermentans TaxID=1323375 RepID=A0A3Q9HQX8_9FIRM|nr:CotS family spore coat protein [Anoxybacter fermentans]AZR73781.1 hypothetical protein BBF96_10520 [Anoxybacter fermentans]
MGRRTRLIIKRIGHLEKLNRYYDLDIQNIHRGRERLILDTPKGQFQLIPTDCDEGFLIFLFSAQQHLKANGFEKFLSLYQSKEAYPYIKYRDQLLVLMDRMDGEKFTYTPINITRGMETLAEFHRAARGLNPMPGSEFKVSWGKWPDRCFEEINELVKYKLIIKDKKQNSFDEKFYEQVDRLIERGLMAWQRFNHEDYRKLLKREMEARAFNLHSYKDSKLQLVDDQVIIKNMLRIRYEVQVYDLAVYLDEILKATELPVKEVAEFIDHYTKIRPLRSEEWDALIAFLLYPKGLYRLIRHYYKKRKVKDSLERFDDLLNLIDREDELITYLEQKKVE